MSEPELAFQKSLREKNTSALLVFAWLSSTLVPLFWGLDFLLIPAHVGLLGVMRLLITVYGGWLLWVIYRRRDWMLPRVQGLGPATVIAIEASISLMCWLQDGYESQYYAGVCLAVLASGTLFLWTPKQSIFVFVSMYTIYMAPLVFGIIPIKDVAVAVNNQFFLISTVIIVAASQAARYRLERTEFYNLRSLAQTSNSLESALARLKELDRAKSNFFNNITHELRTPLTMILSPLENILSGELGRVDHAHEATLKLIWRNALKLLKLINDLLDLARVEEQHLQLRREPTDLGRLAREILEQTVPLAARKRIDVQLAEPSPVGMFNIDPSKMERVFVNVISNALKFTERDGAVRVTLSEANGIASIEVSDTGIGIAPDKLDVIFQRFSQADASVTRRFGGTGIGLAFAREITRAHGGDITVKSEPGVGSTFTIVLPRGEADVAAEAVDAPTRGPIEWAQQLISGLEYRFLDVDEVTERRIAERGDDTGKATKVLVVEDNVELLRFLHLQLQDRHAVYLARNGVTGLELARREQPDVIVSDYMMDEMDGLTMIAQLKADPRTMDIPVILLTAERSVMTRVSARQAGADIYLEKPFSPRELRAAVVALLKRRGREVQQVMRAQVRSLESVSAGLAHEIRNPLTYIKNAVFVISESVQTVHQTIKRTDVAEEERARIVAKAIDRMERMQTTADRGIQRVEQVLETLRRYAREGYPSTRMPAAFDALVQDVVGLLRPKGDRLIQVEFTAGAGDAAVDCVADELQQVVRNLVQNAIDAAPEGSTVAVRTRLEKAALVLEVQDWGAGIARELQSRIFTPFFSTKGPGEGMGLGLAIVDQVVREHGGSINVDSTPGAGSTFRVWLPVAESPAGSLAA